MMDEAYDDARGIVFESESLIRDQNAMNLSSEDRAAVINPIYNAPQPQEK